MNVVLYDGTGRSASERSPSCAIIIWRDSGSSYARPALLRREERHEHLACHLRLHRTAVVADEYVGMVILLSEAYVHAVRSCLHSVLRQICHYLPQHVLVGANSDVVLCVRS